MAEAEKFNIDGTWYDVSDPTARAAASNAQTTANSKLSDAPSDGMQYVRKNGAWAEAATGGSDILYFYQQVVSAATEAQIMRIPASGTNSAITTDTIVLECTFADPGNISGDVVWTSYAGYIAFTGTCSAATTANVTLGTKSN